MQRRKLAGQSIGGLRSTAGSTLDRELAETVARVAPSVLRVAYLLTGRWSAAEGVVEAAYAEAVRMKRRICRAKSPDQFLRDVMLRSCVARSRDAALSRYPADPASVERTTQPDLVEKRQVRAALAQLPRFQRELLVLRFHADISEAATAGILGRTIDDVSVETARAMQSFAARLADQRVSNEYLGEEQE